MYYLLTTQECDDVAEATRSGKHLLGIGIYTPTEAAYYARVQPQTITRWLHGSRSGQPVVRAQLNGDAEKIVTFLDFVQALAIRAIRRDYKLPLQTIRDAVNYARKRYGVDYPFATRHQTFLFGRAVMIDLPGRRELTQISGKQKDQLVSRQIAEPYMLDLTYKNDLAVRYQAFERRGRYVIMDPRVRFGQPLVAPNHHPVHVLLGAYRSEGSAPAAARVLDADEDDVLLAIAYDDYLRGTIAA